MMDAEKWMMSLWRNERLALAIGIAVAAQGVLLVGLAQMSGRAAVQLLVLALVAGWASFELWRQRRLIHHRVDMAIIMVSFGGLGMLIGSWADAGFGTLAGSCCAGHGGGSMLRPIFTWMTGLMLAGAIPPAVLWTRCAEMARHSRRRWWAVHIFGNGGMIWGMILCGRLLGARLGLALGAPAAGAQVAMVAGMVAGMILAELAFLGLAGLVRPEAQAAAIAPGARPGLE